MSSNLQDRKSNKIILEPIENPPKTNNNLNNNSMELKKNDDSNGKKTTSEGSQKQLQRNKISKTRLTIKRFMSHRAVQWFIIFLVSIYTLLIFTVLAIEDIMDEGDSKDDIMLVLLVIEITILISFVIEISLTAYAQGFKFYFRDGWLVFDAVVILVSIIFVIVDLVSDFGSSYKTITSMLRGIFRFVRIFLLIRKVQTFKRIKSSARIKTAAEQIMETLGEIRDLIEITEILGDIDWAMEMIGSNKLYDPVLNKKLGAEDEELFKQYYYKDQEKDKQDQDHHKLKHKKSHKIKPRIDKILPTIPNKALQIFENLNDLEFNCVELQKITKGQELSYLLIYLFEINELYTELDIHHKVLKNFALRIQNGYRDNSYHNSLHAFDVTQTVNFFLNKCKFKELAQISDLELATMYLSSAFHDFEHPGTNNAYMTNTQSDLAITYNDVSVLENHHVAAAFALMQNEELDVAQNFSTEDYKKFRELSISIVLATDMSKHFTDIAKIKGRLQQGDFDILSKDKTMCIDSVVHASDISNPIKQWDVCFYWTEKLITGEFWSQGDSERQLNLPITYLCDRYTTNMAKCQAGFIDFVVRPLYDAVVEFIPELKPYMANFDKNKESWAKLVDKYEKELEILNQEKEEGQGEN